jgi:hypothetical protein
MISSLLGVIASAAQRLRHKYRAAVLASFPTAYWQLDETSGNTLIDSVGGYDGTGINLNRLAAPAIKDGFSTAVPDSTAGASIPHNIALNPTTGEYAIEMWLKWTSNTQGCVFGKFELTSPFDGPSVIINCDNETTVQGKIQFRESTSDGYRVSSISSALHDGIWRHFVFQRRLVSGSWRLEIYIDGMLDNYTVLPSVININNSTVLYLLGRANAQSAEVTVDETSYYVGKSLSSTEVTTHYDAARPRTLAYQNSYDIPALNSTFKGVGITAYADDIIVVTKRLVSSGGKYQAWSAWPTDAGNSGNSWISYFYASSNTGSFLEDLSSYRVHTLGSPAATAALAEAATLGRSVTFTGKTHYKIGIYETPINASDNRGGLSITVSIYRRTDN